MWVTLERTCFATSLDRLVRLSGPARSLSGSSKQLEEDVTLNAPQEVMRLINWLMGNATEVVSEHIFYAVWMLMCIPLDKIVLITWRSDFSGTDSRSTSTHIIIYSPKAYRCHSAWIRVRILTCQLKKTWSGLRCLLPHV